VGFVGEKNRKSVENPVLDIALGILGKLLFALFPVFNSLFGTSDHPG
jgi:hypothetical protein